MGRKWPNLLPVPIAMNYEIASFQEMQMTFPNAQIFGCLFHLTRNMKKKLTNEQLLYSDVTTPTPTSFSRQR